MIRLKREKDLEFLRVSGKILAELLGELRKLAFAGTALEILDLRAREILGGAGAKPAFLGYKPAASRRKFPAAICASVNEKIVHGIPSDYVLREGDVLKIDVGVNYKGYFTDAAVTVGIGKISETAENLIRVTEKALIKAIGAAKAGNHLGDIGAAVEDETNKAGFSVIKGLTGHGVGFELHEDPTVWNYGKKGEGMKLVPGLCLAIEPMIAVGTGSVRQFADGSYVTEDGSLSAHFEHTVAILDDGPEILTSLD